MVSWQSWALSGLFRWSLKRHGDKPIQLDRVRATTRKPPARALLVPQGMRVDELRTDSGLNFDVVDRTEARLQEPATVVLYLHGGGYFFGSPKTHRQVIIAMAKAFDAPAYGLDYRLAPEHPFPAAVDDATQAYRWLIAKYPTAKIVLAGDSAGGGLALVTSLWARDSGLQQPAAIVAFSPWTDLAMTGDSVETNAKSCAMFTPKGTRAGAALYLAGADPRDPRASPLYADLTGLPPLLLFASRHEILLDDTVRFAERAKTAGVTAEVVLRDRLPHVWPIFVRLLPEGREALATVQDFARRFVLPQSIAAGPAARLDSRTGGGGNMPVATKTLRWLGLVVAGIILGILPARVLTGGVFGLSAGRGQVSIGPWQTSLVTGGADADMYTRTQVALTGLLALNRSETTYFVATRDDAGRPLRARCDYDVSGASIDARWWSITAYADDNFLIENPADRFSFNINTARPEPDGRFALALGPRQRVGNWLPTGETGGFNLLIRAYNPSSEFTSDPKNAKLPEIKQVGECSG